MLGLGDRPHRLLEAVQLREVRRGRLDRHLVQFEEAVTAAGGQVRYARDADDANGIVVEIGEYGAGPHRPARQRTDQ